MVAYGFYLALHSGIAEREILFRKTQLEKPVYVLNEGERTNPPWNSENMKEWLYRPIKITGRLIHSKAMLIPRKLEGYHGYDYVVPLVTKENEDGTVQEGLLVNKGWVHHDHERPTQRFRLENAWYPETFTTFLSVMPEQDYKSSFFKEGNMPERHTYRWGHVYLPDMAKYSGFKNFDSVKLGVLEAFDPNTQLDERSPHKYSFSLGVTEDYPYPKTRGGALHLNKMPWELKNQAGCYTLTGLLTAGFGLAVKFL